MSEKSRDELIDKIEKLMRRTREGSGCSEAEIEQSLAFARKLMDKHNIEMSEVLAAEGKQVELDQVCEECVRTHSKTDRHEVSILHTVQNICDVKAYFQKDSILKNGKFQTQYKFMVVGFPNDVLAAKMLYSELLIASLAMTRQRLGKGWSLKHKYYCNGFCAGLAVKSVQLKNAPKETTTSTCTAMILRKDVLIKQHMDELKTKPRKAGRAPKAGDSGEYYAGREHGMQYDLHGDRHTKLERPQKRIE